MAEETETPPATTSGGSAPSGIKGLLYRLRHLNKTQLAMLGIGAATLVVGFLAWRAMQANNASTSTSQTGLPTDSTSLGGGSSLGQSTDNSAVPIPPALVGGSSITDSTTAAAPATTAAAPSFVGFGDSAQASYVQPTAPAPIITAAPVSANPTTALQLMAQKVKQMSSAVSYGTAPTFNPVAPRSSGNQAVGNVDYTQAKPATTTAFVPAPNLGSSIGGVIQAAALNASKAAQLAAANLVQNAPAIHAQNQANIAATAKLAPQGGSNISTRRTAAPTPPPPPPPPAARGRSGGTQIV